MRTQFWSTRDAKKLSDAHRFLTELHWKLVRAGYFEPGKRSTRRRTRHKRVKLTEPAK